MFGMTAKEWREANPDKKGNILLFPSPRQMTFTLVPLQDFSKPWTDEELYKKYGLTDEEIQFIESMIRPME